MLPLLILLLLLILPPLYDEYLNKIRRGTDPTKSNNNNIAFSSSGSGLDADRWDIA